MATFVPAIDDSVGDAIALAVAGDELPFARIIRAHHDNMTRVCFVICGDLDVADEAVQAAWQIVWRKLGSLRDPGRLRPWLVSIAANEARQLVRHRRRRNVVELAMHESVPLGIDPAAHVADLNLANALGRLPSRRPGASRAADIAGFDGRATIGALALLHAFNVEGYRRRNRPPGGFVGRRPGSSRERGPRRR